MNFMSTNLFLKNIVISQEFQIQLNQSSQRRSCSLYICLIYILHLYKLNSPHLISKATLLQKLTSIKIWSHQSNNKNNIIKIRKSAKSA
jgi:hypothetical protein